MDPCPLRRQQSGPLFVADINPDDVHYQAAVNPSFDEYIGQQVVVINEFAGELDIKSLTKLMGYHPHILPQKCTTQHFLARLLILTSRSLPEEWYEGRNDVNASAITTRNKKIDTVTQIYRDEPTNDLHWRSLAYRIKGSYEFDVVQNGGGAVATRG